MQQKYRENVKKKGKQIIWIIKYKGPSGHQGEIVVSL
jgi:hypothetical protein